MIKQVLLILSLFSFIACHQTPSMEQHTATHTEDTELIKAVMQQQQNNWNKGDIDAFMLGYWNNEKLTFIGSNGLTHGWQTTLENYKKGYPDKATMGELNFDIIGLKRLSSEYYHMIGKYTLKREKDESSGYFTLLWEKINGEWKIIIDQTCG